MNIEKRTTHNVAQGSPEWLALRAGFYTASEAPAMAGESRYAKREELIAAKATGIVQEPDSFKQALYDRGHAAEAAARPLAEEIIGDDLSPVTMTAMVDGLPLLASMDGLNFDGTIGWETKLWNEALAADVRANTLSQHYTLQMDQQILVSGAERILFTCSDGTPERTVSCWYESTPERSAQLVAGWKQFAADRAAWVPPEAKPAPVVAASQESLPAVSVRVDGQLAIVSNLPAYGVLLREFIGRIPVEPSTDQEFADTEAACKRLKRVEDELDSAEDHALAQLADVNVMRQFMKEYRELARTTRLQREKLVTLRKDQIRGEIVAGGITALREHIAGLNAAMPAPYMPQVPADFAGAIKGKRTVDSLRSAVNDELARAKIEASNIATRIHANAKTLKTSGLVVTDAAALVLKAPDDLAAIIATRKAAEQQHLEAERERIRQEEAEKLQREQLAKQVEQSQKEMIQVAQAGMQAAAKIANIAQLPLGRSAEAAGPTAPAARTSVPTLRIGTIKERLQHMSVTAEDLRALGFEPAGRERAAPLYHDDDFPAICEAIAAQALAAKAQFLRVLAVVAA